MICLAKTELTPVEDAERVCRRVVGFRNMGFDEPAAQALASSGVTFHAVTSLLKKGCPKYLVARILS